VDKGLADLEKLSTWSTTLVSPTFRADVNTQIHRLQVTELGSR
jgi:hypothetical protein